MVRRCDIFCGEWILYPPEPPTLKIKAVPGVFHAPIFSHLPALFGGAFIFCFGFSGDPVEI
jgi:hypothetical protein